MTMIDRTDQRTDSAIVADAEKAMERIDSARKSMQKVIFGQESVIENAFITILDRLELLA